MTSSEVEMVDIGICSMQTHYTVQPVELARWAEAQGFDSVFFGEHSHLPAKRESQFLLDAEMPDYFREISDPFVCMTAAAAVTERLTVGTSVCLVPERREELTTEGGLDVVGQHNALAPFIAKLNDAGVRVSLFIAAEPRQIEMAARLRAPVIEIHTGAWCDAVVDGDAAKAETEWQRIVAGAALARSAGLEVHAGHGLDYVTAEKIAALLEIVELNIGYYMIGEALFVGLGQTVRAMRAAMDRGRRNIAGHHHASTT